MIYAAAKYLVLNYAPGPVLHALKKVHYARKLKTFPLDKEPDIRIVSLLVSPGDHVVDIGANVGLYTRVLSGLVGEGGAVYSIEPVPATYDILCSNIRALCLKNVLPINNAVSDSCGMVTMSIPLHQENARNYYRAHIAEDVQGGMAAVRVLARTMDAMFSSDRERISFVKCDVEGHELQCLKGAGEFLEGSGAGWLMEVSGNPDQAGSPAHALFLEMCGRGYRAWWFDGKALHERMTGDESMNYFFLKARHVEALKRKAPSLFEKIP